MKKTILTAVICCLLLTQYTYSQPGTINQLAKFTTPLTMENSIITDNGTEVGIGVPFPAWKLDVGGSVNIPVNLGYKIAGFNMLSAPGTANTFVGIDAGFSNTFGSNNTANGYHAFWSNTTGTDNIASGTYALYSNISGFRNSAVGVSALYSNITGSQNTANGWKALYSNTTGTNNIASGSSALYSNTTGSGNIAIGSGTLYSNTTGTVNTAVGADALYANTAGGYNTAVGTEALTSNTTGSYNTANGFEALYSSTTANSNTANGYQALWSNLSGAENTATGYRALYRNTTGSGTAHGSYSLYSNTTGIHNNAYGYVALYSNTTGNYNSAYGSGTLYKNSTGWLNTAIGGNALWNNTTGYSNTANGHYALLTNVTGNNNTALGYSADVSNGSLSNATAIGNGAVVNASNKIRMGNAAVTVMEGPVFYTVSDGRFKSDISEDDVKGLEFIKRLRPVAYNFNTGQLQEFLIRNMPDSIKSRHMDQHANFNRSSSIRQTGLVAQEMEQAMKESGYDFSGLHVPESDNDNYSIAYGLLTIPLVKAVQEQQKMIEEKDAEIQKIKTELAGIEKRMAQLEKSIGQGGNDHTNTTMITELSSASSIILNQNEPNPFAEQTTITYHIPADVKQAQILFYDAAGRIIKTVEIVEKGRGSLQVFASSLSSGMYVYSIIADGKRIDTKKMVKSN